MLFSIPLKKIPSLLHFVIELFLAVSGESLLMKVRKKDLRTSRDWLGDRWVDIKAKPDITPTIFTSNNSFNPKLSTSPSMAKDADSVGLVNSCHEVLASNKSNEPDIVEEKVVCGGAAEDGDCVSVHENKPSSEKSTQVDDIEDNGDNHDDKGINDDNGDRDVEEVSGNSGPDECKGIELMEVAV